jgi:hypothetical protein
VPRIEFAPSITSFKILDELFFIFSSPQPRFRWGKEAIKKQPKLATWREPLSLLMFWYRAALGILISTSFMDFQNLVLES